MDAPDKNLTAPHQGDFLRLWSGQTVSEVGSQVSLVALPLTAMLVLHASSFAVAALSSLEFAPFLFFGMVAGVWVDRLSYRRILVSADIARAVALGSIPLAYALDVLTLGQLYIVGFLVGSFTVFFGLAYQACLPSLLERDRLVEANTKLESTRSVAQTGGPAIGGALVSLASAPVAVLADAVSFAVSGALIAGLRADARAGEVAEPRQPLMPELREGITYVWRHPMLRANLFSSGLANLSYGIVWALLLVFAVRELGLGPATIGVILGVGQAGGIVGAVLARRIASQIGVGPTFILSIALSGPAVLLLASATRRTAIPSLAIGWALWSFAALTSSVVGVSIRQAIVPQRLQGRVVGATRSVIFGIAPIGSLLAGAIATLAGVRAALIIGAVTAVVAFVPLLLSPARALRDLPVEPDVRT